MSTIFFEDKDGNHYGPVKVTPFNAASQEWADFLNGKPQDESNCITLEVNPLAQMDAFEQAANTKHHAQ